MAAGNSEKEGESQASSWLSQDIPAEASAKGREDEQYLQQQYALDCPARSSILPGPNPDYAEESTNITLNTKPSFDFSKDSLSLTAASYALTPPSQRRTASTSNLHLVQGHEPALSPTIFDPPPRSIFTSGPPTASVSASTAQASMSSAASPGSSRPLAALTSASQSRRNTQKSIEIQSHSSSIISPPRQILPVPEKDIDDPSTSSMISGQDVTDINTSATLSKLFAVSTPISMSRAGSHLRGFSGTLPKMEDTSSLTGHLLHRGFMDGRHSDITINAFGHSYQLHKLLLDRVPFFASAFSGSWAETSAKEMTLHPEDIDGNITRPAFELALKRVYGAPTSLLEEHEALGLFATACWLDMPDMVDSSVDSILRQMHPSKLETLIRVVTSNYYGKAGDRILASCKAMLCREGWEMPYRYWDRIPAEIIREIVGGDAFYIPGEWERWFLSLKLLNRRLKQRAIQAGLVSSSGRYLYPRPTTIKFFAVRFDKTYRRDASFESGRHVSDKDEPWLALYTSPEIAPLLVLLDEGIHYVHLRFEQLQQMRTQKDVLGVPVLPEKAISDALWMSMELRQRIVNAPETDLELGLSEIADEYAEVEATEAKSDQLNEAKGKHREYFTEDPTEMESGSWDGNGKPRKFWIPSTDISYVMGGSRDASLAANLVGATEWASHTNRLSASLDPSDVAWAADFTGSTPEYRGQMARSASRQPPRYSHYPPFRFSAEFPNPRTLKEKKRVYSQTVWYAGSMWNLYCQRVNTSKNQQLGIYLHRAKDKDPSDDPLAQFIPATVDDRIGQLEREMLLRKNERRNRHWRADVIASGGEADREDESNTSSPEDEGAAIMGDIELAATWSNPRRSNSAVHKTSQTPNLSSPKPATIPGDSIISSEDENEELARTSRRFNVPAMPPYIDGRPTIKTYFKIYSPSKGGRMLSIYESAPDRFNFSQSWGWKSSQMVLDDGVIGGVEVSAGGIKGVKDGKLRYMVVIGNV